MTRLFRGRGGEYSKGREVGGKGWVPGNREGNGVREAGFEELFSTLTLLALTDIKP